MFIKKMTNFVNLACFLMSFTTKNLKFLNKILSFSINTLQRPNSLIHH